MSVSTLEVTVTIGHDSTDTVAAVTSNGKEIELTALTPYGDMVSIITTRTELMKAWAKRT